MTMIDLRTRFARGASTCRVLLVVLLVAATSATAALGSLGYSGWGVRAGLSSDPSQFVLGMHVDLGELAKNFRLVPNMDIGFGDDLTVFTLNPDLVYHVPLENAGELYFGGTVAFVYVNIDLPSGFDDRGIDTSSSDIGVVGIVGYQLPVEGNPIFIDLKVGISDEYPDLKIMGGYTFRYE